MNSAKTALLGGVALMLLVACSNPAPTPAAQAPAVPSQAASAGTPITVASNTPAPVSDIAPPVLETAPIVASVSLLAPPVDTADWSASPATKAGRRNALLRAEVLLARAHFSPGVIDGQDGGNLKNAIAAFEAAHNLPVDGAMDEQVWAELAKDIRPALTDYVITPDDVKGPFLAKVPTDMTELAKLPAIGFTSPAEALAEKFHMDEALLKTLNPGVDFAVAGARIAVAALGADKLPAPVTRVEVDKTKRQVRAYGGETLLAVYPATVGSTERPAPQGDWAVRTVAPNPTYTYDPSRLTFGKAEQGKLTIKAGPNNPVGATWIDLTKDTYGIHGTPDPRLVGKTASRVSPP